MITGYMDDEHRKNVADILLKPFELEELLARVQQMLGRPRSHRRL